MRKPLIALAFAAAACAFAVPPAAASPGSGSGVGASDEKIDPMICRRHAEAGSRVRKNRVCLTRSEWVKLENETRADWNEFRRRATFGSPR